jgi:hypothetical protein
MEALKNLSPADQPKLAQGIPGRWKQVKSDVPTAMNRVESGNFERYASAGANPCPCLNSQATP